MNARLPWTRIAAALLALTAPAVAHAVKLPLTLEDASLNVGLLLQPQAQLTLDGAPTGNDLSTDLYLRRVRLIVSGNLTKRISFFVETDQPNFGRKGDYSVQFFIQDAFMSFDLGAGQYIDAGLILLPFSHNGLQSAISLNALDYHATLLKYPANKVLRDMGLQWRGLVLDKRIHYRVGVFNGVEGRAAAAASGTTPAVSEVNPKDRPEVVGTVRLNILGAEEAFFFPGITFDKPTVSVGFSTKYQPKAINLAGTLHDDLGLSGDVFADMPFLGNQEVVGQAAYYHYNDGSGATTTGNGFFVEAGYRYAFIEPVGSFEFFDADDPAAKGSFRASRLGVNVWIHQHASNVKVEASSVRSGPPGTAKNVKALTAQLQLFF